MNSAAPVGFRYEKLLGARFDRDAGACSKPHRKNRSPQSPKPALHLQIRDSTTHDFRIDYPLRRVAACLVIVRAGGHHYSGEHCAEDERPH